MSSHDFYRQRIAAADQTGFALLRRLPSTMVWKTLGYVESLSPDDRGVCLDACADIAQAHIECSVGVNDLAVAFDASVIEKQSAFYQRVATGQRWSCYPDLFLRQLASNQEWLAEMVGADRLPAILACPLPEIAKAPQVRSVVHKRLKQAFAAKPVNLGGGNWGLNGEHDGHPVSISLDYGGMGSGFRYGVNGLTLESSYGFLPSYVDCPFASQLDELAETLERIVIEIVELQASLPDAARCH